MTNHSAILKGVGAAALLLVGCLRWDEPLIGASRQLSRPAYSEILMADRKTEHSTGYGA